jgi:hypothetical protein
MALTTIPEDEAVDEPLRPPPIGTYTFVPPDTPPVNPFAGTADETSVLEDDLEAMYMFAMS